MKKNLTWKGMRCVFFLQTSTCIQINKNTKMKKKHYIFIIQNNNKNRKHIKIKNKKDKSFLKTKKHEHPGSSEVAGCTPSLYWVWHCSFLPTKNGKEIYPSCNALPASYFPNAQLGQWNGLQVMASEIFYL